MPVVANNHPGSQPYPPEIVATLAAAAAKLPADYIPRTRHYDGKEHAPQSEHADPNAPAGAKPNFTNRLLLEASPYLRQHAHNPVDWRPWGKDAFDEARALHRPIFLSIGYATCHWCHVMEHESFEDLLIAQALNSQYVPIKVDREVRPDVDAVYMAAVHALGRGGGWPMSVWMLPDPKAPDGVVGLPFFAGTYYPPHDGDRGQRTGFLSILTQLSAAVRDHRGEMEAHGVELAAAVKANLESAAPDPDLPTIAVADAIVTEFALSYDAQDGGRRGAPKFPSNTPFGVLLRHHLRTGDAASRDMVLDTLRKMVRGGIWDHVGGGIARYSTDARWFAPHFEKMLYDQGLVGLALVEAVQLSGDAELALAARSLFDFAVREFVHPDGGFYSAFDADSSGKEGLCYLWSTAELAAELGQADGAWLGERFGATQRGNFEGSNILHLPRALTATDADRARPLLEKLRHLRAKRVPPLRDDKVLPGWNGLMATALAHASTVLAEPRYLAAAQKAMMFVHLQLWQAERLHRSWLHGHAAAVGQLDDYANVVQADLAIFEASHDPLWLQRALQVQTAQDRWFADSAHGGYFATPSDGETLLGREKSAYDGAEPCGNSVAALNLVRLSALTGDDGWRAKADGVFKALGNRARQQPMALTDFAVALQDRLAPMKEVVLVRAAGSDPAVLAPLLEVLRTTYMPHRVVVAVPQDASGPQWAPLAGLLQGKVAQEGQPTAYVCRLGACKRPTRDPAVLRAQLLATD